MLEVYTDGSCFPNPGPGGWGVYVEKDGKFFHEDSGGTVQTTNNRMELQAAIEGLKFLHNYFKDNEKTVAYVISDSQYVIYGITRWIKAWKRKGWVRGKKGKEEAVLNTDKWKELLALSNGLAIRWEWVKSHSGVRGNEAADKLAVEGRAETLGCGLICIDLVNNNNVDRELDEAFKIAIMDPKPWNQSLLTMISMCDKLVIANKKENEMPMYAKIVWPKGNSDGSNAISSNVFKVKSDLPISGAKSIELHGDGGIYIYNKFLIPCDEFGTVLPDYMSCENEKEIDIPKDLDPNPILRYQAYGTRVIDKETLQIVDCKHWSTEEIKKLVDDLNSYYRHISKKF